MSASRPTVATQDAAERTLADLGQKVLNAVAVSERLGHTNLRHSLRYLHPGDDQSARLVMAVIDGDTERATEEAGVWLAAARAAR